MEKTTKSTIITIKEYNEMSESQKQLYSKIELALHDLKMDNINTNEAIKILYDYVDKQIKICLCSTIL